MLQVPDSVSKFITWWSGELAEFDWPQQRAAKPWRGMLLRSGRKFDVYLRQGNATRLVGALDPAEPARLAREVVSELERHGVSPERLVLRLAPHEIVATRLSFPAGVRDVLDQVLRNQLERVAPWPPELALFSYRTLEPVEGDTSIEVELWVAGRTKLEQLLADLAAIGLKPGVVDSAATIEDAPVFNLIDGRRHDSGKRRQVIVRALSACAAVTLVWGALGMGYVTWLGLQRSDLDRQIAEAESAARAAARPQDATTRGIRDWVLAQRRGAPVLSLMMEELSRVLPDDAVLDRLEMRDGILTIAGKAQNVPALIGPLEAARHFEQVDFAAATTRQEGETRDGFSISAHVKPILSVGARKGP